MVSREGKRKKVAEERKKDNGFDLCITVTWKVPRVVLVQINFGDYGNRDMLRSAFATKVVDDEFFICWMESESRG